MEVNCPNCQQLLRLQSEDSGKQARCPKCQTVFVIPGENPNAGQPQSGATTPEETPSDQWHLKIDDGRTFGPVDREELDSWKNEGRVIGTSQLRRTTDAQWVPASEIYPDLGSSQAFSAPAKNPYAANPGANPSGGNPYTSPASRGVSTHYEPHRGVLILVFGILGIMCCCIFAICAWVMGSTDLAKMKRDAMDPDGRGLTQAGFILGIIGTVLGLLGAVIGMLSGLAG